jgi:hypothetical protein
MPATTDYLPTREADLLQWSANFDARITAGAASYGLTPAQATVYNGLHSAFQQAWQKANENLTRTPAAIQTKKDAKKALISGEGGIRELAGIVQEYPGTTDTERVELGLTVRAEPSPIPVPQEMPGLDIVSVTGRTVKIRIHDASSPSSRAKPDGVLGAGVYSFVGATPAESLDDWTYEGSTTKNIINIEFPASVPAGSKVWLSAYWFNPKVESGSPCEPVSTHIAGGLAAAV